MLNKKNISSPKKKLIIYILLTIVTLAVFWQVNYCDFIEFDDNYYVTENSHIWSGLTPDGIRFALTTKYTGLWNPLVWISFMLDYQFYGQKAGGYHLTNLILHLLSALMLFWLFNRMTGAIWRSAFVAALFAIHPMHVESVAWIAERKDVLSAFFWMLTLCLYVYYTEKPVILRYLPVLGSFSCALMSKPMVVTLPVVMILLDYWPLDRLQVQKKPVNITEIKPEMTKKGKMKNKSINKPVRGNLSSSPIQELSQQKMAGMIPVWQLREKTPFFVLSAILALIMFYIPGNSPVKLVSFGDRIVNALVTFVIYLEKTFWPHNMALFYPFPAEISVWQVIGAFLLIASITTFVVLVMKRRPYLAAGWLWFTVTILPVIGIMQIAEEPYAMADRYHYLSSVGIAVMLAWGIPSLIKNKEIQRNFIFPAVITFVMIMAAIAWNQCGYWKNSSTLFNHTLRVTQNNYVIYSSLGSVLYKAGKLKESIENYNEAIRLRPDYAPAYGNRGLVYANLGNFQAAIENYDEAIRLKPDYAIVYNNRGLAYANLGRHELAIENYKKATQNPDYANAFFNWGVACQNLGHYQQAIEHYNETIRLKPSSGLAYNNRAVIYFLQDNRDQGCIDAQKACSLGVCKILEISRGKGLCR